MLLRCMILMAPLKVIVPATKSVTTVKWLCSCSVNPVTLLTSFEVWSMCSIARSGFPLVSNQTCARSWKKSTKSSWNAQAGLNAEQSIVSAFWKSNSNR